MIKHIAVILATALAACGATPAAPTSPATAPANQPADRDHAAGDTAAAAHDHAEHEHEHEHAGTPDAPAPPADPVQPEAGGGKAALLASERSAWDAARPVFDKACASCHTAAGKKAAKKKLDHFNMDTYPLGGHHTQTIGFTIRNVLGISGKPATMPYDKPGSVQGDDLAKIKAWTDAWEAAETARAHPAAAGGTHDD